MIVSIHKLLTNLPRLLYSFYAPEVEFFQFNLLYLHPGCHYNPASCHGMPKKTSHGGFAYILSGIPSSVYKVDMTSQHAFCLATKIQIKVTDREDCILSLNLIFSQRSVT